MPIFRVTPIDRLLWWQFCYLCVNSVSDFRYEYSLLYVVEVFALSTPNFGLSIFVFAIGLLKDPEKDKLWDLLTDHLFSKLLFPAKNSFETSVFTIRHTEEVGTRCFWLAVQHSIHMREDNTPRKKNRKTGACLFAPVLCVCHYVCVYSLFSSSTCVCNFHLNLQIRYSSYHTRRVLLLLLVVGE